MTLQLVEAFFYTFACRWGRPELSDRHGNHLIPPLFSEIFDLKMSDFATIQSSLVHGLNSRRQDVAAPYHSDHAAPCARDRRPSSPLACRAS
jgi:hypothetical protein